MSTTTKNVYVYFDYIPNDAASILQVPAGQVSNLESAIIAGSWWTNPTNVNDHWDMSRAVRYTVAP